MSHSTTQSQWLTVDDTDARLHYSPAEKWQLSNGSTLQNGNDTLDNIDNSWTGKIWNNTAHGITSEGANVTFRFNGTGYAVFGSYLFPGPSPEGRINCFLDGNTAADDFTAWHKEDRPSDTMRGNMFLSCGNPTSKGEHELVIKVDSLVNSTFFLDYIVYEPISSGLKGQDAEQTMMLIGDPLLGTLFETRTPGASTAVEFNGTSIQLYGNLGIGSNISNSAIYQLDDQPPQSFPLVPPFDGVRLVQQFFNLSGLSPTEEHKLVVTHNGTEEGMALALDFFVVERVLSGTVVSSAPSTSSSSPSPSPSSPSSPASATTGKHRLEAGALGGIIGGTIVLLVLCGIGSWLCLKSCRKARNKRNVDTTPFVNEEGTGPDFNPYDVETQMIGSSIPFNPYKRSRFRNSPPSPKSQTSSPADTRPPEGDDAVNQLRWGNLKLQQRLAVLMGRNQDDGSPGEPDTDAVERRPPHLVVHADSGWRMEQRRDADGDIQEVPPTYTEA